MSDAWLSIEECAGRVKRSKPTIYRWVGEGLVTVLAGRIRESQLLEAERAVRLRRAAKGETLDVPVVVDGKRIGAVRYNPTTGRVVGEIGIGMTVTRVEVS